VVHEVAVTAGEIIFAAQEIVWTVRGLVGNGATTSATADEIISTTARVVLAIAEVPATAATTFPPDAGVVLGVHRLVLTAETIVLCAAKTPANLVKPSKSMGKASKVVKCCVWVINSSSPPVPKVDIIF